MNCVPGEVNGIPEERAVVDGEERILHFWRVTEDRTHVECARCGEPTGLKPQS